MPKQTNITDSSQIHIAYEILGWYGALAIVGSYILVTTGTLAAKGIVFQACNLTGGIAVAIISWYKRAHQPVFINLFRASTAAIAIMLILIASR